ncbi:hypothetical protein [Sandaracinobacteroides hominis]|uniref:hypothetical protein n=1 Tax=Sandaracinobacteroides hominis TaxID=2780086 RepID=UPI0018F4B688|nr:hypothetical protein [Sandaracinobacteroides hominis]
MTALARLLPITAVSPGWLLSRLEQAHPELLAWSRSEGAAWLPPGRLAQAVLAAMPAAFATEVEELLARDHGVTEGEPVRVVNSPAAEILSPGGTLRWSIGLRGEVLLRAGAPGIRGEPACLCEAQGSLGLMAGDSVLPLAIGVASVSISEWPGNRTGHAKRLRVELA